ncbi:MAG: uracil permease [Cyanobacteriota bacterium]
MSDQVKPDNKLSIIDIEEKPPFTKSLPLSFQHLFAMFGASILVPILFKVNPATVLLFNGVGTLIYLFIAKGKIPAFLGSSFAFIAPVFYIMEHYDYQTALGGFICTGIVFTIVALIVNKAGINWLNIIFPPASIGAIVAIIGLELGPTAAKMAGYTCEKADYNSILVASVTLATVILGSVLFRGFLKAIPVLIRVVVGYLFALSIGMVNVEEIGSSSWLSVPTFYAPKFNLAAIMVILPAAFVVIAEHIGHLVVTGNIVARDLTNDPGLDRSLFGNGISTIISGIFGSVPTTTYAENIGVMAITRVYSVWVIGGAAVISMILAFSGKLIGVIKTIPSPVIGGISLLLFGIIAASGLRILIEEKVDYSKPRNLILTSMILIVGLSGTQLNICQVPFKGMALATIVAVALNLIFIVLDKLKLTNELVETGNV